PVRGQGCPEARGDSVAHRADEPLRVILGNSTETVNGGRRDVPVACAVLTASQSWYKTRAAGDTQQVYRMPVALRAFAKTGSAEDDEVRLLYDHGGAVFQLARRQRA